MWIEQVEDSSKRERAAHKERQERGSVCMNKYVLVCICGCATDRERETKANTQTEVDRQKQRGGASACMCTHINFAHVFVFLCAYLLVCLYMCLSVDIQKIETSKQKIKQKIKIVCAHLVHFQSRKHIPSLLMHSWFVVCAVPPDWQRNKETEKTEKEAGTVRQRHKKRDGLTQ